MEITLIVIGRDYIYNERLEDYKFDEDKKELFILKENKKLILEDYNGKRYEEDNIVEIEWDHKWSKDYKVIKNE